MVADYKSVNEAALKPGGGTRRYNEIDPVTTAYIRSQEDVFAPQTMEQARRSRVRVVVSEARISICTLAACQFASDVL